MARILDFLNDVNGDLLIRDGDFVIGRAELKHAKTIIESNKGEIRKNPLLGLGLEKYIGVKESSLGSLRNRIINELKKARLNVYDIDFDIDNDNITYEIKLK